MRPLHSIWSTSFALSACILGACQGTPAADPQQSAPQTQTRSITPSSDPETFPVGTVIDSYGDAVLSELETSYGIVGILRVVGTPSEMGYQYGRLLGPRIIGTWTSMIEYLAADMDMKPVQAERVLAPLLDRAYSHMEPYVPQDFKDEIEGVYYGATDTGITYLGPTGADLRSLLKWMIALSNTTDLNALNDGGDAVLKILMTGTSAELDQFYRETQGSPMSTEKRASEQSPTKMLGRTCSFFAAWGRRTGDGRMLASRNLDWANDTGIQQSALVTIYVPTDGYSYATFGYAGFMGALAGLNENGIVVSEIGSNSVLEKLKGEPWALRFREILSNSDSLATATSYMVNSVQDGLNRPTTLGYNFMVGYGDPATHGAKSEASIFESNGGVMSVFHRDSSCSKDTPTVHVYDREGHIAQTLTLGSSSEVNLEASTREIDAAGAIRRFKVENGQYVRDGQGYLVEDAYGEPLQVGRYLDCALFRGDEAMSYATRRWQTAANGPLGDDTREVMYDSESYTDRYMVMQGILNALWTGGSYQHEGVTWVQAGNANRPIGPDEAVTLTRAAAMDSNVMNVVYDATELKVWLAYESGSDASWLSASDTSYTEMNMGELFRWQ